MFQPMSVYGPGCTRNSTCSEPGHGVPPMSLWPSRSRAARRRPTADRGRGVVVDAEQAQGLGDQLGVAVAARTTSR